GAVAAVGKIFYFKTAAFVRGEDASPLNPTLTYCRECGMELFFMSRAKYKAYDFGVIDGQWADAYQIPEGGSNCAALEGFTDFVADIKNGMAELPDYICVAARSEERRVGKEWREGLSPERKTDRRE